jgi:signal transduction histidine kinase/CheY-like chemotaxis protein/HPt (histidine-containing phosphotransfer) domain-containing protein
LDKTKDHILSVLNNLTESIASASDAESLCDALFKIVDDFVDVRYSGIYLWDFKENRLKLYNTKGFSTEDRINSEKTALERHPGWVFKNRKSLHIKDMMAENVPTFINSNKRTFPVQSRLWVPIATKSKSLGSFGFASEHKNFFTKEHIKVLEMVCRLAGNIYASIVFHEAERGFVERMKLSMKKIEEANNAQQNFLAKMSHEMRTPLNGIIGIMHLLDEDESLQAQHKEYVNIVTTQSSILLNLVNDVLDISKLQSENFTLVNFPFNLRNVTENIVKSAKIQSKNPDVEVELTYDELIEDNVIGDELRYSQILTNLLNNAIKFTKKGKISIHVTILSKTNDLQEIKLVIQDTGIGIDAEKLDQIFERFTQADESISRAYGGSGLGLYITKEIIHKMNGSLQASSLLGEGSTFSVHLPFTYQKEHKISARAFQAENLNGLRILLAEDNPVNVIFVRAVLEKHAVKVDVAQNGSEAVQACQHNSYDLILMDLQMPVMDGFAAVEFIRKNLALDTPIIAQTANTVEREIQQCYEIGINDFLAKPFKAEQLIDKIINQLYGKKAHAQIQSTNLSQYEHPLIHNAFALFDGDRKATEELLEILKNEMPKDLHQLRDGLATTNTSKVNQVGHKAKSSFRMLKMNEAADICLFFEKADLSSTEKATLNLNLERLEVIVKQAIHAINNFKS